MADPTRIPLHRTAARLLPVNDRGAVLLLQGFDPAHPEVLFWFSVGGGLDEGESFQDAAVRELVEETGIVVAVDQLHGPLGEAETIAFSFGGYDVVQDQTWWAVAVGDVTVSFDGLDEIERDTTVAHRWWTPADLDAAGENYLPGLPEMLRAAVAAVSAS